MYKGMAYAFKRSIKEFKNIQIIYTRKKDKMSVKTNLK